MKYQIIDTSSGKPIGEVWLENGKLKGNNEKVVSFVRKSTSAVASSDSELFKLLPKAVRSGYVQVRKIES